MNDTERDKMLMEIHANVAKIIQEVTQHHKELYGNGQPGLLRDVVSLKTEFGHQEDHLESVDGALNAHSSKIASLEKEHAVYDSKLDTGKAVIGFIVNLLIALASLLVGIFK